MSSTHTPGPSGLIVGYMGAAEICRTAIDLAISERARLSSNRDVVLYLDYKVAVLREIESAIRARAEYINGVMSL